MEHEEGRSLRRGWRAAKAGPGGWGRSKSDKEQEVGGVRLCVRACLCVCAWGEGRVFARMTARTHSTHWHARQLACTTARTHPCTTRKHTTARTHAHMKARTHASTLDSTHARQHAHTKARTHESTLNGTHARKHARKHESTHARQHARRHARTNAGTFAPLALWPQPLTTAQPGTRQTRPNCH